MDVLESAYIPSVGAQFGETGHKVGKNDHVRVIVHSDDRLVLGAKHHAVFDRLDHVVVDAVFIGPAKIEKDDALPVVSELDVSLLAFSNRMQSKALLACKYMLTYVLPDRPLGS